MRLMVTTDQRFGCTPDGAVWTPGLFAYPFWTRYLAVFEHVRVVGRVQDIDVAPADWIRGDGEGVSYVKLPHYVGPLEYLVRVGRIRGVIQQAMRSEDAIILRASSTIGSAVEPFLTRDRRPYGVEVVTDPYDVFAPGSIKHPLRPYFRWRFPQKLRRQCAAACCVSYVTKAALQQRYPPSPGAYTTHYSSVELPDKAFVTQARSFQQGTNPYTLITVASLANLRKATDVLLKAVKICVDAGTNLKLVVVGDGRRRPDLEGLVDALGLGSRVLFTGNLLPGDPVRSQLDQADLFVLPSHMEGLPRAMIEAMARALPCIGSTVGGIPELLPSEDMVPPGDAQSLAGKIQEILSTPERMTRMSARNLDIAQEYEEGILRKRRAEFYEHLRDATASWLKSHVGKRTYAVHGLQTD